MTRKTEQGTRLPKIGTQTTVNPIVPNPTPEERGNVQFATVQPGSVRVGGPGMVSGWSGVRFPVSDKVRIGGDLLDACGLYLTTPGTGSVLTRSATKGGTGGGQVKPTREPREGSGQVKGDGPSLDGFSVCAVIRWLGAQGFTAGPVVRAIRQGWGVEVNPVTSATQVQHGRKGKSVPSLPVDLQARLRDLMTAVTS